MNISVLYKPVVGLSPLHLVVLAAIRVTDSLDEVREITLFPKAVAVELVDDLKAWALIRVDNGCLRLDERGTKFGEVIGATEGEGGWSFECDDDWLLGEGSFSLSPGNTLSSSGADLDAGIVMSEELARIHVEEFSDMEREIQPANVGARIRAAGGSGTDPEKVVVELLDQAQSWPQYRRLSQLIEITVGQLEGSGVADPIWIDTVRRAVAKESKRDVGIGTRARRLQLAQRVLLADWLRKRKGLLGALAKTEPWSFVVTCRKVSVPGQGLCIDKSED